MSDLQRLALRPRLPMCPSGRGRSKSCNTRPGPGTMNFGPVHWSDYFHTKQKVDIGHGSNYCVYRISNSSEQNTPTIMLLHGGGFSALSWCVTVKHLLELVDCRVIAVDLRGHGETETTDDYKLRSCDLVSDLLQLMRTLKLNEKPLVVIGHSMGGAIGSYFAQDAHFFEDFNVVALVVIDVVEGSALESLVNMNNVLRNRPTTFPTLEKAILWCARSGQLRNVESARVSVPGQLKSIKTNESAVLFVNVEGGEKGLPVDPPLLPGLSPELPQSQNRGVIPEESETTEGEVFAVPPPPLTSTSIYDSEAGGYTWRIDLSKTEPYWNDWFKGLSEKFLETPCPKLLLLAGVDRLDKELTVGQMQGKFQMQVMNHVGHAIHEDSPAEVANSIASFLARHKLVTGRIELIPVMPGC